MFSHGTGGFEAAPVRFALDEGEQPAGQPSRVILWGPGQPLAGGWLLVTDRALRFWPTWQGMEAVRPLPSTEAPAVRVARAELRRVAWKSTAVFLRRLVIEDPSREISLLADRTTLDAIAASLGVSP